MSGDKTDIAKLEFQIRLLANSIDHKSHPLESLILNFDWTSEDLHEAEKCFLGAQENIDEGKEFDPSSFEKCFKNKLGLDNQDVINVAVAFYRSGQWVEVCKRYAESFGDNPPSEIRYGILAEKIDHQEIIETIQEYRRVKDRAALMFKFTTTVAVVSAIVVLISYLTAIR